MNRNVIVLTPEQMLAAKPGDYVLLDPDVAWSIQQAAARGEAESRAAFRCLAMVGAGLAYGMVVTSAAAHQGRERERALELVRACGVDPVNFMKWGACECCKAFVVRTRCPTCYRDLCPRCLVQPTCAHSVDGNHDDVEGGALE